MNLYENLKKNLNESYGDKENDLNHDAGYLFDAKNCRKYLNDLKKILVYNSDQYRAIITNLDKGGECQITIDYYMLVALCKLYEERIKELESNNINEAEEPLYDSIMIDVEEFAPVPVCYNFKKPMTTKEIKDILKDKGYELDSIGDEVKEKELKGKTFQCNIMNEAEEPEKNYEQMSLDFSEPIGFRYIYNFMLQCPVNDFDAASSYLTEDDMKQYIDEELKDVVTRVEWILDDTSEGHVEVDTNRELTDEEKTKMIDWIEGQNSDGLGEGFEQQDFAESYYNPMNGDGPFTYDEAVEEVQRLYDELEPSEYADYIDDEAMENAIDRYIEENYDEESAEEVDRYEIQDTILEDPESYFDSDDIDNAKNKAIKGDSLYNENDWYTMASINWQNHKDDFDSVEELRTKGV